MKHVHENWKGYGRVASAIALGAGLLACAEERGASEAVAPGASGLVHLADALERARVSGAELPAKSAERTWRFDEPSPEWRAVSHELHARLARVTVEQLPDGLRLALAPPEQPEGPILGGLAVDLPEELAGDPDSGSIDAWSGIVVRARSSARLAGMGVCTNVDEEDGLPNAFGFFSADDKSSAPVFNEGSVQDYFLRFEPRAPGARLENFGFVTAALGPQSLDVLAITLVPRGAGFDEALGARPVSRGSETRRTLYAHTPVTLTWGFSVPPRGRLDLALACLPGEEIDYTVRAQVPELHVLLDESVSDAESWKLQSLDLSMFAGRTIELTLEASSERPGSVGLWGSPILSGDAGAHPQRPNVIFYVIDGGGADLMSLYGYDRRTTPFLEKLAAEGVVFERAFSNATWTQPSTASFMTSLQHSVLGGLRRGVHSTPVPAAAVTLAEHMRRGGWQTASFTANPNAGRVIGLERGLDLLDDGEIDEHSTSSIELHEHFWRFREQSPGEPYWVHFQTTDVHEPNEAVAPFAGMFVSEEENEQLDRWDQQLWQAGGDRFGTTSIDGFYDQAIERGKVDRAAYFKLRRGRYDETMAHQDHALEQLVERLKAEGEWENTLLVIGADHGHPAGTFARFGRGEFVPQPESWQGALFDSYSSRVPLVFVWPAKIAGGRRVAQPVSMIDVLPTIVELCGLPPPAVAQGHSLAPFLLGKGELAPRPVILDEFRVDEATGEMIGNIEIVDGRWGASLEVGLAGAGAAERGRHDVPAGGRWGAVHPFHPEPARLLLYDLEQDRFALRAVNDEHPELVERYEKLLREQWQAHRDLAQLFGEAASEPLSAEQLQELQALGYIR